MKPSELRVCPQPSDMVKDTKTAYILGEILQGDVIRQELVRRECNEGHSYGVSPGGRVGSGKSDNVARQAVSGASEGQ